MSPDRGPAYLWIRFRGLAACWHQAPRSKLRQGLKGQPSVLVQRVGRRRPPAGAGPGCAQEPAHVGFCCSSGPASALQRPATSCHTKHRDPSLRPACWCSVPDGADRLSEAGLSVHTVSRPASALQTPAITTRTEKLHT